MTMGLGLVLVIAGGVLEFVGVVLIAMYLVNRLRNQAQSRLYGWTTALTGWFSIVWLAAESRIRRLLRMKPRRRIIQGGGTASIRIVGTGQGTRVYRWNNDSYEESIAQLREFIERIQESIEQIPNRLRPSWQHDIAEAEERITTDSPLRRDLEPLIKYASCGNWGVVCLLFGIVLTMAGNIVAIVNW
jgi:hypothetical protein